MPKSDLTYGHDNQNRSAEIALAAFFAFAQAGAWILLNSLAVFPILAACGILGALLAIRSPFAIWTLLIPFAIFKIQEVAPGSSALPIPFALLALSVISLAWHLTLSRRIVPVWSTELKAVLALLLTALASVAFAQNHAYAVTAWVEFLKIVGVTLFLSWVPQTAQHYRWGIVAIVGAGFVIASGAIYNWIFAIHLVELTRVGIGKGFLGNPNDLGLVLLLPLSVGLAVLVYRCGAVLKLFAMVGTLTTLFAIVLTQSRGALLGLATVAAVVASRFFKSKTLTIGVGLVAALVLPSVMGTDQRISGGLQDAKQESVLLRTYAWQAGLGMALSHPTGVGMGNFIDEFSNFTPVHVKGSYTAHSIWFLVLGELGFPGLLAFLWVVIATFISSVRNIRESTVISAPPVLKSLNLGMLAGLLSFCVCGSFVSQSYAWPIYLIVALTTSLSRSSTVQRDVPSSRNSDQAKTQGPSPREL